MGRQVEKLQRVVQKRQHAGFWFFSCFSCFSLVVLVELRRLFAQRLKLTEMMVDETLLWIETAGKSLLVKLDELRHVMIASRLKRKVPEPHGTEVDFLRTRRISSVGGKEAELGPLSQKKSHSRIQIRVLDSRLQIPIDSTVILSVESSFSFSPFFHVQHPGEVKGQVQKQHPKGQYLGSPSAANDADCGGQGPC